MISLLHLVILSGESVSRQNPYADLTDTVKLRKRHCLTFFPPALAEMFKRVFKAAQKEERSSG